MNHYLSLALDEFLKLVVVNRGKIKSQDKIPLYDLTIFYSITQLRSLFSSVPNLNLLVQMCACEMFVRVVISMCQDDG